MRLIKYVVIILIVLSGVISAQNEDIQLGTNLKNLRQNQGAFYDYSDPSAVNIKVAVWGYVKYPGKYIVPAGTGTTDLISYAGGPITDALLENVAIYRTKADSTQEYIKLNYNSLMWEERFKEVQSSIQLKPGDVLLIPGEPRYFLRDYISIILPVASTFISLLILIATLVKK